MGVMARESWTDERLDDFKERVEHRFNEVDRRFDEVDKRFDKLEARIERIDMRLDSVQRTMVHGFIAMAAVQTAGFAAILGLIATGL